jgi:hypothetical protein
MLLTGITFTTRGFLAAVLAVPISTWNTEDMLPIREKESEQIHPPSVKLCS